MRNIWGPFSMMTIPHGLVELKCVLIACLKKKIQLNPAYLDPVPQLNVPKSSVLHLGAGTLYPISHQSTKTHLTILMTWEPVIIMLLFSPTKNFTLVTVSHTSLSSTLNQGKQMDRNASTVHTSR